MVTGIDALTWLERWFSDWESVFSLKQRRKGLRGTPAHRYHCPGFSSGPRDTQWSKIWVQLLW